jgi:hypothetical protein
MFDMRICFSQFRACFRLRCWAISLAISRPSSSSSSSSSSESESESEFSLSSSIWIGVGYVNLGENGTGRGTFAGLDTLPGLDDVMGVMRLGLMSEGEGCVARYSVISFPFCKIHGIILSKVLLQVYFSLNSLPKTSTFSRFPTSVFNYH